MTLDLDPALVTGFALALVRASAWVFVLPIFGARVVPVVVKVGLAATLAVAAAPRLAEASLPVETGAFVGALVFQAVIGLLLGLFTMLLFSAIPTAGSLIDLFAGYSLATVLDPLSETQISVFGRFYQVLGTTLLFATNAHLVLIGGFLRSFDVVPVDELDLVRIGERLVGNLGELLVAALEIAGPVLACLFLAELTLGLLARAAPALNVFALAFPVRVLVALLVVALALPLLTPALDNLVREAMP